MARNEITNDTIANTKGSAEKHAQGWDRLFGAKKGPEKVWHMVNGSSITFKDTGGDKLISMSTDGITFPTSHDGIDMRITAEGGLEFKGLSEAESQAIVDSWMDYGRSVAASTPAPNTVMALNFHDRLKPGANFFPNNTVFADNNGNAIMSSGSIPLYQDPSHNG